MHFLIGCLLAGFNGVFLGVYVADEEVEGSVGVGGDLVVGLRAYGGFEHWGAGEGEGLGFFWGLFWV